MAKDDIDLDDINFDDENWDMDFDVKPPKDDRNPVKKIASGAVKGFKSSFKDPQFIKKKLLQTLPPGYSKAADLADEAGRELSDLYNTAAKEMEPMRQMGVKITKSALPKLKGKLPKKIEAKLQDILDEAERNKTSFKVDQDQANMTLELGEIFKTQMEHQEQLREKSELNDRTKTVLNFKQHKESLVELSTLRQGIDKLVGYQDSINFKFQKKSLELQFKQYYAQRDLLELTKTTNKSVIESLTGILKNTGLPEHVKVQTTETGKQMLRERMLKSLGGTIQDFAPNYIKNFSKNLKDRAKLELGAMGSMFSMGDMMDPEMMREMGIDPLEMMGEVGIGGGLANTLSDSLIYRYKDKLPFKGKINKWGNKLSMFANDLPTLADEYARSSTKGMGVKSDAVRFMKSMMPKFNMKTSLESDSIKAIDRATHFDAQTRKSIVEIIPGYLARILRSIDVMRTGDESIDMVSYDLTSNRFAGRSELKKTLTSRMFSKTNIERANLDTEYVMQHLDPDNKLAPDLKKLLKSQMLSDVQQNKRISVERYLQEGTYSNFVDKDSRAKLVSFFQNVSGKGDETGAFGEELSRRSMYLRNSIPNTREMAQTFINAGYGDLLQEAGLVNKMGDIDNLDFNKVLQVYREGVDSLEPGSATLPTSRSRRRGIGRRQQPILQEAPSTTYRDESPSIQATSTADSEIKSFLDLFKMELFQSLAASKMLDEERNIKLDEMILRMEGLGVDGANTGPGTRSFKMRAKSLSSRIGGAGGKLYDKAKGFTKSYFSMVGTGLTKTKDVIGQTIKGTKDVIFNKVQDVYLKGNLQTPKLRADLLRAGEYRDKITGKVIRSIDDIKGEIVDSKNNIVLSMFDIQEGLVNKKGEKIRSFISRFFGASFEVLGKLAGSSFNVMAALTRIPSTIINKTMDLISGKDKPDTDIMVSGETDPRLTVGKLRGKEYFHGKTGELLTSFKDLKFGVKDKAGNWLLTPEEAGGGLFSPNGSIILKPFKWMGSLAGGLLKLNAKIVTGGAKLIGKVVGKFKEGMSPTSVQISLLTQIRDILDDRLADETIDRVGSAADILSRRKGKGKKDSGPTTSKDLKDKKDKVSKGDEDSLTETIGSLGAAVSGLSTMMGWIGKALKLPITGALRLGTMAVTGISSLAAGAAAGTGVGGTLMAVGAGAASMVGTAVAGLASILSAPVVLGAAAIAAVAYGGYKLYKYLKNKNAWLTKIRMAQYGVDPSDGDRVEMIGDLEGLLASKLVASAGGYSLKLDDDSVEEILDIFDIDKDDKENIKILQMWFDGRFKPVYLAHVKAMDRFAKGSALIEADDKVPLKSKLEYIKVVSFGAGQGSPYSINANPFDGDYNLPAGDALPKQYIDQAIAYYKKEMDKEGISASTAGKAAGVVVAKAATDVNGQPVKAAVAETSKLGSLMGKALPFAQSAAKAMFVYSLPGLMAGSMVGKLAAFLFGKESTLDAFTAVRVKAYGLTDLSDAEKIKTLLTLEETVNRKAKLKKDGGVDAPISEDQILADFAGKFGIDTKSAGDLENFFVWFKSRFLPVCLKYYSMVRTMEPNMTVSSASEKLKPSQKAAIAKELVNVKVSTETNVSIWTIAISPFPGEESNTDKDSCNGHIKYLESMTSEKEVKTQDMAVKKTPGKTSTPSTSFADSFKSKISNLWGGAKEGANKLMDKAKDAYAATIDATSRGMEKAAEAAKGAGEIITSGAGAAYKAIKGDSAANQAAMIKEMLANGVTDPTEQAMYMAQLDHESGGFKFLSENLKYGAAGLMKTFGRHIHGSADAEALAAAGPEAIANRVYGNRMGNVQPGDGFKYRGRGFIQLTGKENYTKAGAALGLDLVNNPDLASQPANAARIAWWYLKNRVSAAAAKAGDIKTVTKQINGGYNHLAERAQKFREYLTGIKEGKIPGLGGAPEAIVSAGTTPIEGGATGSVAGTTPSAPPSSIAKPSSQPSAPPAGIAKPQPQSAVAGLMNINPFDTGGMNKSPAADVVAANTGAANKTMDTIIDKQAYQSNANQDYQAVSMEAQRKASSDYLNGGVDKMSGVLGEQLNVQKSIDTNIKQLVQLISSGKLSQQLQSPQTTPVTDQGAQQAPAFESGKTVRGPVSMRRTNV